MARNKQVAYVPMEERPAFLALVADLVNIDAVQFPDIARQCAEKYHDAVLAGHVEVLDQMEQAYKALVFKLNGETMFGCSADKDSAANVLERHVAAKPGQVPSWGQSGEFLLEIDGLRVRVVFGCNMLGNHRPCDLYAVDLDRPFISTTGYRSAGLNATSCQGETVDQAARRLVLDLLNNEGKAKPIAPDALARTRMGKVPGWLAEALAGVQPDGQLAMFGDAPPSDKPTAKSNADRQRALRERRKAQQLKPVILNEAERLVLEQLREVKQAVDSSADPRPFLLTQRDRGYLTSALDYYEYATCSRRSGVGDDYQKNNMRDLYIRLSVHKTYAQATDFPLLEKRRAWENKQTTLAIYDDYKRKVVSLEKENALLENERNKSLGAIQVFEARLRNAGLSTDYRRKPGE